MNNFFVVTNTQKDPNYNISSKIKEYLLKQNKNCYININNCKETQTNYSYTSPCSVPKDTECIITLGGDGTLIQAARDLCHLKKPFIGINYGKLGYLAEVEKENIISTMDLLINNNFTLEKRMMLSGTVIKQNGEIYKNIALNDIVINRASTLRIMDFSVLVNNKLLYHYIADGMIVSTPTGSTAYNMSAGGPIVEPSAELMVLTPICAHSINTRSIVLSANDNVSIVIGGERSPEEEKFAGFDGYDIIGLHSGDRIDIKKSDISTDIIKISDMSFLEILKNKMGDI